MSDASANGDATAGAAPEAAAQLPKMQILGQFTRDLSFENAAVQNGVAAQGQPDIQVQVALDARKRTTENQYDVIMKLKVESKTKEDEPKAIFLIELEYGGVFLIENIAEQQLHPFLMIECPRMLFPFARRIISDVSRDGGYPPLNLDQIDFVALYRQQIAARQAQQPQGTA
ncbi:protein-export chaperone SecB [Gymnodinialimonas ceratoperidinii]|uniref:Protein-export protein SecB n=1 Tax=Gymnodinialimonas ceratoperidinii TaxID=2856823 RepID=A0A8F6YBE2_9RHOB|nr:protein-export chaperone SecB [Gymnodinialimonas ceratoperidinii]QXT39996.1 protein-export chaperone SecB [Gymnodinialimonas ceratoperidinii]